MKQLGILFALAALGATVACGDDSDDDVDNTKDSGTADAGGGGGGNMTDAAVASRGKQIDNVGAACTGVSDCKGSGTLSCTTDFLGTDYPGGYCTASCVADDECGSDGACPVAQFSSLPLVGSLITQFLPPNCVRTCDKSQPSACRSGYECTSFNDLLGGFGSLLGANASQAYCLPPVSFELPDAAVFLPRDAGTSSDAGLTGGLDSGAHDAGVLDDAG